MTDQSDGRQPRPRLRAADTDRDRVLAVLAEAHAAGRLDVDEVDQRQADVLRSRYIDELWPTVSDLAESSAVADLGPAADRTPVVRPASGPPARPGEPDAVHGLAILSGKQVRLAAGVERVSSFQLWGGDDYDLTDVMGPGVTVRMTLTAIMAGSEVRVPRGVRIVDETVNLMAGNDIDADAQGDGSNGTLILAGLSFWAGHDVKLAVSS